MSDQLQAPAALPTGKGFLVHVVWEIVWAQNKSDVSEKREISVLAGNRPGIVRFSVNTLGSIGLSEGRAVISLKQQDRRICTEAKMCYIRFVTDILVHSGSTSEIPGKF